MHDRFVHAVAIVLPTPPDLTRVRATQRMAQSPAPSSSDSCA
jgi:hypothetical protein